MGTLGAADIHVSAEQNADGTWAVLAKLDAEGCCGSPERDAAAAQSAANRLTAMTPVALASILDRSGSALTSVLSTTPATVSTPTTDIVATFGFVVDAGSYDPDTSPASYAKDLAGEVGSAVISLTPASVGQPSEPEP
jgi:hypothetical protein